MLQDVAHLHEVMGLPQRHRELRVAIASERAHVDIGRACTRKHMIGSRTCIHQTAMLPERTCMRMMAQLLTHDSNCKGSIS